MNVRPKKLIWDARRPIEHLEKPRIRHGPSSRTIPQGNHEPCLRRCRHRCVELNHPFHTVESPVVSNHCTWQYWEEYVVDRDTRTMLVVFTASSDFPRCHQCVHLPFLVRGIERHTSEETNEQCENCAAPFSETFSSQSKKRMHWMFTLPSIACFQPSTLSLLRGNPSIRKCSLPLLAMAYEGERREWRRASDKRKEYIFQ